MKLFADFETNNHENDCRVWLWGAIDLEYPTRQSFEWGTDINSFMKFILRGKNNKLYFHNLQFDGAFVMHWLFDNGYTHCDSEKLETKHTFHAIIGDDRGIYSISIKFGVGKNAVTRIFDSNKILLSSIAELGEMLGDMGKGSIDYNKNREIGYVPADEEVDYIFYDCIIGARALNRARDLGLTDMTIGAAAIRIFKKSLGKFRFDDLFPVIDADIDAEIRPAYKGGWNYMRPGIGGKHFGAGIVLDNNGIYPFQMKSRVMPVGYPMHFDGKYEPNAVYPLYIQKLTCMFKLKPDGLPFIKIEQDLRFNPTECLESSKGYEVTLVLSKPDLELFYENYDVCGEWFQGGYMFRGERGLFDNYIDYWQKKKEECYLHSNKVGRKISKRMLNSLGGKFGTRRELINRFPAKDDTGTLDYIKCEPRPQDKGYVPVSIFMNAYARETEIMAAKKVKHRFLYSDTDSLHLIGDDVPSDLDISDTKLGAWKVERVFDRACFLKKKCYIEEEGGHIHVAITGMPKSMHKLVTFDNFKYGHSYHGKLVATHCKNGVVLRETKFYLKCGY